MRERRADVDTTAGSITMRWLESGAVGGLPVVLLHGIPTSSLLWRHVVGHLGDVRVMAPEMVGYGESAATGVGRDISVAAQAGYLLDWLRVVGIDRAVLVGHDLGGGVAQIAVVRRPAVCAGMVLTNAISFDSWPIPSVAAMQKLAPVVRRLPHVATRLNVAVLLWRGHDTRAHAREALATHWPVYARNGGARTLIRQVQALDVEDTLHVSPRLADLDVPARVVWGEADRFQKVHYGERLAAVLRTHLQRIPGAKHFTPEDHPAALGSAITAVHGAASPG